jgi:hypothetical protein
VTIRGASPSDLEALRRLAQRDTARMLEGPAMIAQVDGELRAALSMTTGSVIADPFHHTAELVEMLRLHAGHGHRASENGRGQSNGWRITGSRRAAAASSRRRTGVV